MLFENLKDVIVYYLNKEEKARVGATGIKFNRGRFIEYRALNILVSLMGQATRVTKRFCIGYHKR
jgi:hypothetical protein